jgi:hypothetical protein
VEDEPHHPPPSSTILHHPKKLRNHLLTTYVTMTDAKIKEISDKMGNSTEIFRAYRWIRGDGSGGTEDRMRIRIRIRIRR